MCDWLLGCCVGPPPTREATCLETRRLEDDRRKPGHGHRMQTTTSATWPEASTSGPVGRETPPSVPVMVTSQMRAPGTGSMTVEAMRAAITAIRAGVFGGVEVGRDCKVCL